MTANAVTRTDSSPACLYTSSVANTSGAGMATGSAATSTQTDNSKTHARLAQPSAALRPSILTGPRHQETVPPGGTAFGPRDP